MSEIQKALQEFVDDLDAEDAVLPEPELDAADIRARLEAARARRPLNKPDWAKSEGHERRTQTTAKLPTGDLRQAKRDVGTAQDEAERAPTFHGGHRHGSGGNPLLALPLPADWERRA